MTDRPRASVRPATPHDIGEIREVATVAWGETYRGILSERAIRAFLRAAYSDRSLTASLASGGLLVLEVGGRVRGYLRLEVDPASGAGDTGSDASSPGAGPREPRIGRLRAIYLHPDEIGRGFGRRLWEAARAWFVTRGCGEVRLEVAAGNERARGYYEHLGFSPIAQATFEILGEEIEELTYRLTL